METLIPISPDNYLDWFDLSSRPLLKLAAKNASPMHSIKLEWLADRFENGALKTRCLSNYTQIMRQPFQRRRRDDGTWETFGEAAKAAGEKILDSAELTLWYGKPKYDFSGSWPLSTCGGVLHYLKRRPYENDLVALRELRSLILMRSRGEHDQFLREEEHTHEWLWEFSLQVIPGHYKRGMKPLAVPPKSPAPKTITAFPQGSTLDQGVPVAV